jgi:hypothetical protein
MHRAADEDLHQPRDAIHEQMIPKYCKTQMLQGRSTPFMVLLPFQKRGYSVAEIGEPGADIVFALNRRFEIGDLLIERLLI